MQHRHDADREITRDTAANLEEADRAFAVLHEFRGLRVPLGEPGHVFDASAHSVNVFNFAGDNAAGVHVAERSVFPAGDDDREVFLASGEHPGIFRINLVALLQFTAAQNFIHELVREIAFAGLVSLGPFVGDDGLDAAHGFHLGDARVGHAVHVALNKLHFVLGREVAVVWHALVVVVSDQVKNVFLKIRAGANDGVDLVLANHFSERDTEFGGGHRPSERDEHLAAGFEVSLVTLGSVEKRGRVKVAVMLRDKFGNRTFLGREGGVDVFRAFGLAFGFHKMCSEK